MDQPKMSRAEWIALILLGLGFGAVLVFLALRLWYGAGIASVMGWSGVSLLERAIAHPPAPQVVHNHQGAKPTPRV